MISPSSPVTSSAGADLTRTGSKRARGLSYLRALSHNRNQGGTSPGESSPSRSPRNYFQRSLSYNTEFRPNPPASPSGRRRSNSRPEPPTSPTPTVQRAHTASHDNLRSSPPLAAAESEVAATATATATEQNEEDEMVRNNTRNSTLRRTTSTTPNDTSNTARPVHSRTQSTRLNSNGRVESSDGDAKTPLPTIRLFPHQEIRNGRPSLTFTPISRTLPVESSIIRVGRYSEREGVPTANPNTPSDAPVGFKSKVVSRKHCEFCFVDGQWQIKDVASSSGTFLNHIRLSQPNTESRLFPVKDGDIVQLGIDFRGGEEMIFRCVKIRIECNRAWQKKPNNYNKTRHQQLQSLAKDQPTADSNSGECSICLGSVLPCQALFVAPCAHVWHYKCIRPLFEGRNSTYPQFQCPNCRAYFDLTADVDVAESDVDEWMDNTDDSKDQPEDTNDETNHDSSSAEPEAQESAINGTIPSTPSPVAIMSAPISSHNSTNIVDNHSPAAARSGSLLSRRQATNTSSPEVRSISGNIDMPNQIDDDELIDITDHQRTRTQTPDPEAIIAGEGPLTPRNNAGPFVFDGSAGRSDARQVLVPGIPEVSNGGS